MKWRLGGFVVLLCQAQQQPPPDLALLAKINLQATAQRRYSAAEAALQF